MICNKIRKPLSLVFTFIITFFTVSCQIMPCFVFAEAIPVGQPVSTGSLWTVIEGTGPEPNLVRDPFLMTVESMTTFGLGTLAAQSFWEETNAEIAQKIQDGTLSNTDVGAVIYKEVDGQQVPVAIKNTIYGQNMYFITDDLAEQIRQQDLQTDAAISAACMDYWNRVIVSDIEPFQQAVEAAENWITSFPDLAVQTQSLISEIMFELFGVGEELDPASTFLDTGLWMSYKVNQGASSYTERKVNVSSLLGYDRNSFVVVKFESSYLGRPAVAYGLYGHVSTQVDPMLYTKLDSVWFYTDRYFEIVLNGIPEVESAAAKADSGTGMLNTLDMSNVFESWPEIVALPDAQPLILPNVHYNVGNITGAVNAICAAADAAIAEQTSPGGSPEFTPETRPEIAPAELPELLPVPYDVPWPTSFPAEFPDPDPWLDPDSNPWPDPVPDPNPDPDPDPNPDPDPDPDPDPGGGYNNEDWNQRPPDRPRLKTPVLFGLFPFCIPFDIKKSIEWFGNTGTSEEVNGASVSYNTGVYNNMSDNEVEEINGSSGDPVFAIPLNLGIAGQPFLQTVLVIDLTEYGIPTLVYYLKAVQIVLWVIALAWATKNVIY